MTDRALVRPAIGLSVTIVLLFAGAAVFSAIHGWQGDRYAAMIYVAWAAIGLVLATRRPRNAIGWLFLVAVPYAAAMVDSFAQRLRDEVELSRLAADLTDVVEQTLQPAHAGIWIAVRNGLGTVGSDDGRDGRGDRGGHADGGATGDGHDPREEASLPDLPPAGPR